MSSSLPPALLDTIEVGRHVRHMGDATHHTSHITHHIRHYTLIISHHMSAPSISPLPTSPPPQAVWSLSSAKPNFGVQQLRDSNLDTYWQSDGLHPHFI